MELACNLRNWFKDKPCKIEDFKNLCEFVIMSDDSLFRRHVSSKWLTLSPVVIRTLD